MGVKKTEYKNLRQNNYAFISCSTKNLQSADKIYNQLKANNISVWMAPYDIPAGTEYIEVINQTIKNCSCFMVLLSEDSQSSFWVARETERAVTYNKAILPVMLGEVKLNLKFELYLNPNSIITLKGPIPDNDEMERLVSAVEAMTLSSVRDITEAEKEEMLYSQVIELQQGDICLFCEKLCDLIELLIEKFRCATNISEKIGILRQILNVYEIYWKNSLSYGNEYKPTANRLKNIINEVNLTVKSEDFSEKKTLYAAAAIALLYSGRKIKADCIDTLTNGDVHGESDSIYLEAQKPYLELLRNAEFDFDYTEDELEFIETVRVKVHSFKTETPAEKQKKDREEDSSVDERFEAIADYIAKGNELFDSIGTDDKAKEFYTCLLMSYERLKNYCLEVGEKKVYGECIIKITELKQLISQLNGGEKDNTTAERSIKALLGLTMPKSGTYDVFISYKHYDEDRAKKVYSFLQQNLKEAFFDKESLPELSKSDYEHAVMTALAQSKHFIVIISDISLLETSDFIEGDWVRREMRTFNTEIQEGRKKDSNFIILASDEICDSIFEENKNNIDIMWRWPEIIRYSEFKTLLAKYIK